MREIFALTVLFMVFIGIPLILYWHYITLASKAESDIEQFTRQLREERNK